MLKKGKTISALLVAIATLLVLSAVACGEEEEATATPAAPTATTAAAAATPTTAAAAATATTAPAATPVAMKGGPGMAPAEKVDYLKLIGDRQGTYYDLLRDYRPGNVPASTTKPNMGGIYVAPWPVGAPNMDMFGAATETPCRPA